MKEKPQQGEVIASAPVVAMGPQLIPLDVEIGDRVRFGKWSGTEVKLMVSNTDHEGKRHHGVLTDAQTKKKAA